MFRGVVCFLVGVGLAFPISLGLRSKEYSTFKEWWTDVGIAIWLTVGGIISMVIITFFGLETG